MLLFLANLFFLCIHCTKDRFHTFTPCVLLGWKILIGKISYGSPHSLKFGWTMAQQLRAPAAPPEKQFNSQHISTHPSVQAWSTKDILKALDL